jgi:SAM-dependent methyltransferase
MRHALPRAETVDRVAFLEWVASGRRVVHVGFWGTEGCRELMEPHALWLHERLAKKAATLIGLDVNEEGVDQARREGYEAYVVDCQDQEAVRALCLDPAEVVLAGEVIEHIDAPGRFLDAMHELAVPGGSLVITTPNAYSMLNSLSAFRGLELINPDHVALYSWYTLTNLLKRHGWETTSFLTYPYPLAPGSASGRGRLGKLLARLVLGIQGVLSRTVAPFIAHGLIAVGQESSRDGRDMASSTSEASVPTPG